MWREDWSRGPVHHHDDEGYQREHQIVEHGAPLVSTPHAATIAPVIVPAPTIMSPCNDVWPSDGVTDDCSACGPERSQDDGPNTCADAGTFKSPRLSR